MEDLPLLLESPLGNYDCFSPPLQLTLKKKKRKSKLENRICLISGEIMVVVFVCFPQDASILLLSSLSKLGSCLTSYTLHIFIVEVLNVDTRQTWLTVTSPCRIKFNTVQLLSSVLYSDKSH